jgi:hypothetical protein
MSPAPEPSSKIVMYTGAGVALAGAVLLVAGIAASPDLEWRCYQIEDETNVDRCTELNASFNSFEGGEIYREVRRPAALTYGSLGLGLLLGGAITALLDWFEMSPWLSIAAGVGAGGAAFGVSFAIDRSSTQSNIDAIPTDRRPVSR